MSRVSVTVDIGAPASRVWRALTSPSEVEQWDGVLPSEVPAGYPQVGQHARWLAAVGPFRLTLHDRIVGVDHGRRLASRIDLAFVHLEEEYRLTGTEHGTRLVSDNEVSTSVPGLGRVARRLTASNVEASMKRLKMFCEQH